jgi:hypothetical protein
MPNEVHARVPSWVSGFRKLLCDRGIPKMSNDHITILSDYSSNTQCCIQSFLLFSQSRSPDWPRLRYEFRADLPDNRHISYKKISPSSLLGPKLQRYLDIADSLYGWSVTVGIHRSLKSLVSNRDSRRWWMQNASLEANWSLAQFENMLRVVHFLSLLLAEVIGDCNSVEWVSDQDEIFANDERCQDVTKVLHRTLGSYAPAAKAHILVGTTEIDTGHRGVEDLCAIPDLACGALAEFMKSRETESVLSEKAITIGKWLAASSDSLQKCSVQFIPISSTEFQIEAVEDKMM